MERTIFAVISSLISAGVVACLSGGQAIAQSDTGAPLGTLYERIQALEAASSPDDLRLAKVTGIVRKPDYSAAKAIVVCWRIESNGATVLAKTETDERGRYSLAVPPCSRRDEVLHFFAIDSDNQMAWSDEHIALTGNRKVSFVLNQNSGRIEGTLVAPGGKPVPGVEVAVVVWLAQRQVTFVDFAPFHFRAISDESGHFVMDSLPAQKQAIVIVKSDKWGCVNASIPTSKGTPVSDLATTSMVELLNSPAELKLYPKCDIVGQVVDSKGNAIPGVKVSGCEEVTNQLGEFNYPWIELDAWGKNYPKDIFAGIEIIPPADTRFMKTFVSLDRNDLSSRVLKPTVLKGEYVSGRVMSATTFEPLPSIRVRSLNSIEEVTTDADGNFRLRVLPGQKEILFKPHWMSGEEQRQYLEHGNGRSKRAIDVLDGESVDMGKVLLDLDPAGVKPLTIRVTNARGTPIANCQLELRKCDSVAQGAYQASLVDGDAFVQNINTDRSGVAILKPAGGWGLLKPNQVPPANAGDAQAANTVIATYQGRQASYFGSVNIAEITNETIELKLTEGARITGQVLLNGKPLEGVTVTAFADSLPRKQPIVSSETDEHGEYIIYAPSAQRLRLSNFQGFTGLDYSADPSKFKAQPTEDPLLFTVPPLKVVAGSGEIRGTVVDEHGAPAPHAIVGFDTPADQVWIRKQTTSTLRISSMPMFTTKADAAGNFVFADLPPGTLQLIATDANNSTWQNKTRVTQPVQAEVGSQDIKIVLP